MAAETEALYARILALVAPRELRRSANDVLREELLALVRALDDAAAAFAKLAEVREAARRLEQDAAPAPSAGLAEALDGATRLQQQLAQKLEHVAAGMTVDETEQGQETQQTQTKRPQETEDKPKKKQKGEKKETREDTEDLEGQSEDLKSAHAAMKSINQVKTINGSVQFEMRNEWPKALYRIEGILKRQEGLGPQAADQPAVEVAARALESAAAVFKKLHWTEDNVQELLNMLAVLTQVCSKNNMLRRHLHRVRAQLESLEMSIPKATAKTFSVSSNRLKTYNSLVASIHSLSENEKLSRIAEALNLMQQVMADDDACVHQKEVRCSVDHVKSWISNAPLRNRIDKRYVDYVNSLTRYINNLPGNFNRYAWQRFSKALLDLLDERKRKLTQPAKPAQSGTISSKNTSEADDRLAEVLAQVEQWQDGIFSMDQLDKVIKVLSEIVSCKSKGWKPRADPTFNACLDKLKSCIKMIKKQALRNKRLHSIKRLTAAARR